MSAPVSYRASAHGRSSAAYSGARYAGSARSRTLYAGSSRSSFGASSYAARTSGGRSAASGYRGARYVPTATAEVLPQSTQPSISVVPGAGRRSRPEGLPSSVLSLAKLCAVAFVLVALVAVVRVTLTSASAACALETQEIVSNIEVARSAGNDLEVSQSVLSNPARIRAQAEALGMAAPTAEFSEQITLDDDIVATDEKGNLSLSESTSVLAGR